MYDITIIGAGIIGSLLAKELSKYNLNVCLLEKNQSPGLEQTMSCSAIIHSGIDPRDGTLKAKLNILGNQKFPALCRELDVEFLRCGALMCATNNEEMQALGEFAKKAKERNIEHQIINRDEIVKLEPNISDDVLQALSMPTTGVVYPTEVVIAALEIAVMNDVTIDYNNQVLKIQEKPNGFNIKTNKQIIKTKLIINAAGIYSDDIYKLVNPDSKYQITGHKGAYFVLNKENKIVNQVLYPTPTSKGKGVLAIPTTHGNTLIGPNSIKQDSKSDDSTNKEELDDIKAKSNKIINGFNMGQVIHVYSGIRAKGNTGDFIIEASKVVPNFINLIGIESPGLASSPAICDEVIKLIKEKTTLEKKVNFIAKRDEQIIFDKLAIDEKNSLIAKYPKYGKIICRCEKITEQEVINAIHRPDGAKTVADIKYSIRPTMGLCQGGFCEMKIAKTIARELNIKLSDVLFRNENTNIVLESKKGVVSHEKI